MDKISYLKCNEGDIVFHQNDIGKEFYIILTGRVRVLYNKTVDWSIQNPKYLELKKI